MDSKKIFVGLSGGVDSAVSATLLKEAGHEIVGIFAWIALQGYPCTAGEDRREALRVAAHLQIPFEEIDLSQEYERKVFAHAIEGYRRGETPNPDALCNREIKFGLLYDYSMQQGADLFATGHYARTRKINNETHLLAGIDAQKDQSYFLWAVPEERLAKTLFPVGEMQKSQVRTRAETFGLPNAQRKDSQGLCFLGDVSIEEALAKELRPLPGHVLDEEGNMIGTHHGAVLYTMGERRGFEISATTAHSERQYVISKDIEKNTITVSAEPAPSKQNSGNIVVLREVNWIGKAIEGKVEARFRYRQTLMGAVCTISDNRASVIFDEPQAIPVGQSLVLYRGERCLGGGVIDRVASK